MREIDIGLNQASKQWVVEMQIHSDGPDLERRGKGNSKHPTLGEVWNIRDIRRIEKKNFEILQTYKDLCKFRLHK